MPEDAPSFRLTRATLNLEAGDSKDDLNEVEAITTKPARP